MDSQETGRNIVQFVILVSCCLGLYFSHRAIRLELRSRNIVESIVKILLIVCSAVAIVTTLGIVMSVLFEALRFFKAISPVDFLFGLDWSPQIAIRADQAGSSGAFGAVPVFVGTILIAFIAMMVAIPIGLLAAIYLSEYASERLRTWAKPILEILAGIPTVVYGFFAALTVAPLVRDVGTIMGLDVSSESALAAGLVMGIMIIPFISSLSDDIILAVPQNLKDGSYALGATKSETMIKVILPAALPGIVGSILLAIVIRLFRGYGNISSFSEFGTMSFFLDQKYPPSLFMNLLFFGLVVLGVGTFIVLNNKSPKIIQFFSIPGKVPLFFYGIHLAILGIFVKRLDFFYREGGILTTFIGLVIMLAIMLPLSKWFYNFKRKSKNKIIKMI